MCVKQVQSRFFGSGTGRCELRIVQAPRMETSLGTITEVMILRRFIVTLEDGRSLEAVVGPGMKKAKLEEGNIVRVELSPYDKTKCRIVHVAIDSAL